MSEALRRKIGPDRRVLLVVDQAEELFTLCTDAAERQAFTDLLSRLADPGPDPGETAPLALVVLALRADFYAHCAELPWLRAAVQNGQLLLGPLSREELLDAIRLPARAAGLRLEPGLVDLLVSDFGARRGLVEPGALPLLAHALRATWQNRQGRLLTVAGYTGTGGVAHALGNSADQVYEGLGEAAQGIARRLFLGLVAIGEDGDGVLADGRRRIRRDQLLAGVPDRETAEAVLAAFTARRLLVQERETVSLTHEALLTAWPTLHAWINDDRPRNLLLQDLDAAARAWQGAGREPDALYRGKPLDRALEAAPEPPDPAEDDLLRRDFLNASVRLRKRSVRIRRRIVAVLVALVLVAGTAAVLAVRQSGTAETEQRAALAARITAQADGLRTADPALAARLDLVAHRLAPRAATTMNLYVDANAVLPRQVPGFRRMVTGTAYRPDGRVFAAVDVGGLIRLWDVADPTRSPSELGKPLEAGLGGEVGFSPDGRLLTATSRFFPAKLWNVTDPARPVPVELPRGAAGRGGGTLAFARDGRTLFGSGPQGRMLAWNVTDPARAVLLPRSTLSLNGAPRAFGPDGRTLAGTSGDSTVRIWDLAHPDRAPAALVPPNARDEYHRTAYRPDGRYLALSNGNQVWVWDLADPARPRRMRYYLPTVGRDVTSLAFSPDGQTLVVADNARTVRLWNFADPADVKGRPSLPVPPSSVRGLTFTPDGRTLAAGTETGPVMLWRLPDAALPPAAYDTRTLSYAPGGRRLATGGGDGTVRLWSLAGPDRRARVVGTLSAGTGTVAALAFGPDGRSLTVGSWDGDDRRVSRWDVTDPGRPRRLAERAADGDGRAPAISPDGGTAVVEGEDEVVVWDLEGPEGPPAPDRPLKTGDGGAESLAVSSGARVIGVGHDDGDFSLWTGGSGPSPVVRVPGIVPGMPAPQVLALSPDGRALAKADHATLTTWELADPARPVARGSVTGGGDVESLAFGPGGDVLAVGDADGTVRFADPANATALSRPLSGGVGRVTALAFAPDGRTLAAGGPGLPVRLWSTDPQAAARWICAGTDVLTPAQWAQYVPGLPYDPPCREEG
ncbi:WD40 repeat domain-containing protein [Streptomyces sp. NPDC051909]|uniref:WD40 repeat domain-containing protein n=1 Tax=Streptomyces sp. NPDC051909 TaxID=3154944 RepID=UPI0034442559